MSSLWFCTYLELQCLKSGWIRITYKTPEGSVDPVQLHDIIQSLHVLQICNHPLTTEEGEIMCQYMYTHAPFLTNLAESMASMSRMRLPFFMSVQAHVITEKSDLGSEQMVINVQSQSTQFSTYIACTHIHTIINSFKQVCTFLSQFPGGRHCHFLFGSLS